MPALAAARGTPPAHTPGRAPGRCRHAPVHVDLLAPLDLFARPPEQLLEVGVPRCPCWRRRVVDVSQRPRARPVSTRRSDSSATWAGPQVVASRAQPPRAAQVLDDVDLQAAKCCDVRAAASLQRVDRAARVTVGLLAHAATALQAGPSGAVACSRSSSMSLHDRRRPIRGARPRWRVDARMHDRRSQLSCTGAGPRRLLPAAITPTAGSTSCSSRPGGPAPQVDGPTCS